LQDHVLRLWQDIDVWRISVVYIDHDNLAIWGVEVGLEEEFGAVVVKVVEVTLPVGD